MDTCPMCYSPFKKPKILPCLDTVCFACLDEHVIKHGRATGSFPCPVCNLELPVPDGGISQFDDNMHQKGAKSLKSVSAAHSSLSTAPCEICEGKIDATQRCIDCEQNFCLKCSRAHLRLNIAKSHTLVNLDSEEGRHYLTSTSYCSKHKHEELMFYCRTCIEPICMRCRLTTHEDHTTEDLIDFAQTSRKDLRVLLDEHKDHRLAMLSDIEDLRVYSEELIATKNSVKKAILQRRQQFINVIERECNKMIDKLEKEMKIELKRVQEDKDVIEQDMLVLSNKIATANQMVDFGSDMEVVRVQTDIVASLALARKDVPLGITGIKLAAEFTCQKQAELSLKYLIGRLSTEVLPPLYINVLEVSTFRVENTSDVINAICPSPDGKCWVACGWKSEIIQFDKYGQRNRSKKVGRDVDCLAIDSDGNAYVSCRDEHSVKRFDRNFRRRMATLSIKYPRGITTTSDNKLVICVNESTTYFDYDPLHQNKVIKLGPDGDESKELKNPSLCFLYPIRVAANFNDELCVSDNLKHAVMILHPNGELKATYSGENRGHKVALVTAASSTVASRMTNMSQVSSMSRQGAVSFKVPESRKEQDGPLSMSSPKTALELALSTPQRQNTPRSRLTSPRALAPIHHSYENTFVSSSTGSLNTDDKTKFGTPVPPHVLALRGLSGAGEAVSVTDVGTTNEFDIALPPFDPRGITCDKHGHVIVADYSSNLVHLLDKQGRFLMYLLTEADGIFGPTSVAIDSSGLLWVGGGDATVKVYKYIEM